MTDSWRGYHLLGGNVALDLVNTVSWRLDQARTFDRLTAPDFLPLWLTRTELGSFASSSTLVEPLRELRETLYRLLTAPAPADVAQFSAWLSAAHSLAVAPPSLPLRWTVPVDRVEDVIPSLTLTADELLRSPDAALVRQCSGPGCGWLFLDRTRNHSRQWCSSQDCGNRERARRHYQRSKTPIEPLPNG
ncbi:CGNR zinc finger domain-containing protein [Kibdelosporangium philippinense]|uniref:CGNR zinc finger domain-containing protein n=1 Tax=Kibdelosporangium philippinense TaxID=211113 RepID=A0ABS8ZUG5_9PSEU|nr:CGNR zinc finger domain-containing protein [Kibdelosporangium philippinense]MCE7010873.1 CGNR zinc finger domain-containing protein [Kibdelosporangium philippinense]